MKQKMKSWAIQILIAFALIQLIHLYQKRNLLKENAPNFSLRALDGKTYSLSQDKKYLIYFFAPWCTVCKLSFGNLSWVRSWKKNSAFEIYAIALSYDNENEVRKFVENYQINFPVLLGNSEIAQKYKIQGFPTIYVINERQEIMASAIGYTSSLGMWWRTF